MVFTLALLSNAGKQQAMWPITTDVAHSMVCVLGTRMNCAKMSERIQMRLGSDSYGFKEPRIGWVSRSPNRKRQLWGCPATKKHWESLLQCMQQKGLVKPQKRHDNDSVTVAADCNVQLVGVTHVSHEKPPLRCGLSSKFFDHLLDKNSFWAHSEQSEQIQHQRTDLIPKVISTHNV